MLSTFELKSYKQLELLLGFMNTVLVVALLLVMYFRVLTAPHRVAIDSMITAVSDQKIWALAPLGAIAILWAWTATQILRLHDRVHEPLIRKWRASYDADFILRALVLTFNVAVPTGLFERAYAEKRLRDKLMQRLFYNFIGDETKIAEGRRVFFYGEMGRYWTVSLLALYCFLALITYGVYALFVGTSLSAGTVLIIAFFLLGSEMYSNLVLDSAHAITLDQVAAVWKTHPDEWRTALSDVLAEEGIASA